MDNLEEKTASVKHQIVPVETKVKPNIRKGTKLCACTGLINCGKNAKKNNATFGFKTFVKIPET